MAPDDIRFSSVKEDRGWFFVEYGPPIQNYPFSTLDLTITEDRGLDAVATAMEIEAKHWLMQYPVPLMVTAFDLEGSDLSLKGVRPINHLMAWIDSAELPATLRWGLVDNADLPDIALNRGLLMEIFAEIPYKTGREIQQKYSQKVASRKIGLRLIFLWVVVVPLIVAIVEWSSDLLGLLVLVYAFVKAGIEALRLTGRIKKSKGQLEEDAKEVKMRHHHYHCERNPEAFERLKAENFQREAIERTKAEALALKRPPESHAPDQI